MQLDCCLKDCEISLSPPLTSYSSRKLRLYIADAQTWQTSHSCKTTCLDWLTSLLSSLGNHGWKLLWIAYTENLVTLHCLFIASVYYTADSLYTQCMTNRLSIFLNPCDLRNWNGFAFFLFQCIPDRSIYRLICIYCIDKCMLQFTDCQLHWFRSRVTYV